MNLILYTNNSPKNKIGKSLSNDFTLTGTLRNECNVSNPDILIELNSYPNYNYCYIPDFGRYYFITEIQSVRNHIWKISAHCDVLESFKNKIKQQKVILEESGDQSKNNYLSNNAFVSTVKTKTDIISFQNGLLENGVYVLITAGGVASI